MNDIQSSLTDYQDALRKIGAEPAPLAEQAEALAGQPDSSLDAAFQSFHAAADRQPSVWDSDYGALLLEALGDQSRDPRHKARFYEQAGQRIESKLKNLIEKQA